MSKIKIEIFVLLFVLISLSSSGQDSIYKYELGVPLINNNFFDDYNFICDGRPVLEYANGVFFRMSKRRLAIRANVNYAKKVTFNPNEKVYVHGSIATLTFYEDIRIGAGGQFSVTRKKHWLYLFLDCSYRLTQAAGSFKGSASIFSTGTDDDSFVSKSKGVFSSFGFGSKLRLFRIFYVSPELGCNFVVSNFENKRTNVFSQFSNTYKYQELFINAYAKINLTVQF